MATNKKLELSETQKDATVFASLRRQVAVIGAYNLATMSKVSLSTFYKWYNGEPVRASVEYAILESIKQSAKADPLSLAKEVYETVAARTA